MNKFKNFQYPLHDKQYKEILRGDWRWCEPGTNKMVHRMDGPAYIDIDNDVEIWIQDGFYHREDGPALTKKGNNYWFYKNLQYSFNEWCKILNKSGEEIVFLKMKYNTKFNGIITNE